jgi:hypothetical protein
MGLRGCGVDGNASDIADTLDYHIGGVVCAARGWFERQPLQTVALRACTTGRRSDDTTNCPKEAQSSLSSQSWLKYQRFSTLVAVSALQPTPVARSAAPPAGRNPSKRLSRFSW